MLYLFLKALVWLIPIWIIRKKKYCSWDQFKWSLREISKKKDWLTFGFLMFGDKMFWGLCSGFLYWGFIFGRSGLGVHFRTFGVRTLGGPFSDVRGWTPNVRKRWTSKFGRSGLNPERPKFSMFKIGRSGFSDIGGSYVRGSTPNIRKSKTPKTPNVWKKNWTPNVRNPEHPKPRTPNPEDKNPECKQPRMSVRAFEGVLVFCTKNPPQPHISPGL